MLRRVRRVALLLLVVVAAVALLWLSGSGRRPPPPAPGPEPVVLEPPREAPPPARDTPPPEPASATAVGSVLEDDTELPRSFVRASLAGAIAAHLPSHKLSSEELDQLTDATVRLRKAQRALRALPATAEHADERRALLEEIQAAGEDFAYVLEMTPAEFTATVQTEVGVDTFSEDEAIPEPEYLDDLR